MSDKKNNESESVTMPKEEFEALKEQLKEKSAIYDKYLRATADLENARKRFEKDKEALLRFANEGLITEFLPIVDNLEIAERHIKEAKDFDAVRKGVDMIHSQIQKFLKELGIERIKCVGEKFDPHLHEVIEIVESLEVKPEDNDVIIEELKPGYKLNGRLLRPASVKIAKKKQ